MKTNIALFAAYVVTAVFLAMSHSWAIGKGYSDADRLDLLSLIATILP